MSTRYSNLKKSIPKEEIVDESLNKPTLSEEPIKIDVKIIAKSCWLKLIHDYDLLVWEGDYRLLPKSKWTRAKLVEMTRDEFEKLEKPMFWTLNAVPNSLRKNVREKMWRVGLFQASQLNEIDRFKEVLSDYPSITLNDLIKI